MSKLMIVTVGTSLFHSASWDENNVNFIKELGSSADDYKRVWVDRGPKTNGPLYSPDDRKSKCPELVKTLKDKLKSNNASVWKDYVANYTPSTPEMRYSAELATILRFTKREEAILNTSWREVLREYKIVFVCDSNEANLSNIAAQHNTEYIKVISSNPELNSAPYPIQNISSTDPNELMSALVKFQEFLRNKIGSWDNERHDYKYQQIDMIISGGYKIYGLIAWGYLTDSRLRIIYQHEEAARILVQSHKEIAIGAAEAKALIPINL